MERHRGLEDLPLEVLDVIYKYCQDEANKLNLALASPRLCQAFIYHNNDFKIICQPFRLDTWRFILPLCGSNVNELSGSMYDTSNEEFKDLVAMHCPNLQTIKLSYSRSYVDSLISFIWKIKDRLRSVILFSHGVEKLLVKELPEMSLLRTLRFHSICSDDVIHLQKFVNLEELDIYLWRFKYLHLLAKGFPHIKTSFIFAPLKKLRILRATYLSLVFEDTDLMTPLLALEELKLEHCAIRMVFPTCPKLKSMIFIRNEMVAGNSLVFRSILNQGESLESLVYFENTMKIDNHKFLELLRGCRKLRYLKLCTRWINFTLDFMCEIVAILTENGIEPNAPFQLIVNEDLKFKSLQNWLTLTANSELLKPHFKKFE